MTNYFANNTTRVRIRYEGPAGHHYWLVRFGTNVNVTDLTTKTQGLIGLLAPVLYNQCNVPSAQYALALSDAWRTLPITAEPGSSGADYNPLIISGAFELVLPFKSAGDSRYSLSIFYTPMHFNQSDTFAYDDLPAAYTDIRDYIEGNGITGIDRLALTSMGHVTSNINKEVQKKLRR